MESSGSQPEPCITDRKPLHVLEQLESHVLDVPVNGHAVDAVLPVRLRTDSGNSASTNSLWSTTRVYAALLSNGPQSHHTYAMGAVSELIHGPFTFGATFCYFLCGLRPSVELAAIHQEYQRCMV